MYTIFIHLSADASAKGCFRDDKRIRKLTGGFPALSTFITNHENKDLKSRLQELIEISTELKFLVGFFYFSGMKEFYETLKKLYDEGKLSQEHIKILVGLNVDKGNFFVCGMNSVSGIFIPLRLYICLYVYKGEIFEKIS